MSIITFIVVYACAVWLVLRWLRLASLPDRRFLSADRPDSACAAIEMTPATTPDARTAPMLRPSPNAPPPVETIAFPPYK